MTVFTVMGVLWFWMFCWEIGYYAAAWSDIAWRLRLVSRHVKEMEPLIATIVARASPTVARGTGETPAEGDARA